MSFPEPRYGICTSGNEANISVSDCAPSQEGIKFRGHDTNLLVPSIQPIEFEYLIVPFIGAILSEPHTSESNDGFFIYIYYPLYVFYVSVQTVI